MTGRSSLPPRWPARRIAALVLTTGLIAITCYSLTHGIIGTLLVLVPGIVLGILYVVRGGSLPPWAYRWVRGRATSLAPDGDPAHLPVRVYLPILVAIILLAAAWLWWSSR